MSIAQNARRVKHKQARKLEKKPPPFGTPLAAHHLCRCCLPTKPMSNNAYQTLHTLPVDVPCAAAMPSHVPPFSDPWVWGWGYRVFFELN